MQSLLPDSPAATADYRRRARKIRASFSRSPLLRHQALTNLARTRNAQIESQNNEITHVRSGELIDRDPLSRTLAARIKTAARRVAPGGQNQQLESSQQSATASAVTMTAIERGFAAHAVEKLQAFGFTFSDRLALLHSAERLGIARFRANMILAIHEHGAPHRKYQPDLISRSKSPSLLLILGIEICVVGLIVFACMW